MHQSLLLASVENVCCLVLDIWKEAVPKCSVAILDQWPVLADNGCTLYCAQSKKDDSVEHILPRLKKTVTACATCQVSQMSQLAEQLAAIGECTKLVPGCTGCSTKLVLHQLGWSP